MMMKRTYRDSERKKEMGRDRSMMAMAVAEYDAAFWTGAQKEITIIIEYPPHDDFQKLQLTQHGC